MGENNGDGDSFGDVIPAAVVNIPTAVADYLTHGDTGAGVETRVGSPLNPGHDGRQRA